MSKAPQQGLGPGPRRAFRCLQCFDAFSTRDGLNMHCAEEHKRLMRVREIDPLTENEARDGAKHYDFGDDEE